MIEPDDELTELLGPLDPAAIDSPPMPGSNRYQDIEDTIMTNTRRPNTRELSPAQGVAEGQPDTSRRRPILLVAAVAAIALLSGIGLLLAPGSTPSATAAVQAAAQNSADVTDFRVTLTSDDLAFLPGGSAIAEIDGDNVHMIAGDLEFIRIGETEWFGEGGHYQSGPASEVFAPFGEASAQVVSAALASDRVTEDGTEILNGTETRRYRIEIDDASREALAEVPSEAQYWFTAETSESAEVMLDDEGNEVAVSTGRSGFLEDADTIVIWLADDLIHQIEVSTGSTQFTFTFFDFGADITVTPPE